MSQFIYVGPDLPEGARELVVTVPGVGRIFEALGRIILTAGVQAAVPEPRVIDCLQAHYRGEWGIRGTAAEPDAFVEDHVRNSQALAAGVGIMHSCYPIDPARSIGDGLGDSDNRLWIITAADRSTTTVLLPEEY